MQNAAIAALFDELAELLELQGANPFRVRAYRNAARTIEDSTASIADLVAEPGHDLTQLAGIGKDLAEKIETILRRSVLNTRPRDFYDVFILTKTYRQSIDQNVLKTALNATAQKRMSLDALKNNNAIVRTIQADSTMRTRWDRYCREYYFASGISFDEVVDILHAVLQEE